MKEIIVYQRKSQLVMHYFFTSILHARREGRSLYLEDLYVNPAFRGKVNYRSLLIFLQ